MQEFYMMNNLVNLFTIKHYKFSACFFKDIFTNQTIHRQIYGCTQKNQNKQKKSALNPKILLYNDEILHFRTGRNISEHDFYCCYQLISMMIVARDNSQNSSPKKEYLNIESMIKLKLPATLPNCPFNLIALEVELPAEK